MATTYGAWAPTGFDRCGAFLPDRQDWVVVPVMRTRDSDVLAESNFEAALRILDDESEDVEVHRFGHWGPGWFEIILAHPRHADTADEIQRRLEDYPVLDEMDYQNREFEAICDTWDRMGLRTRIRVVAEAGMSPFAARRESPWDWPDAPGDWPHSLIRE